MLKVQKFIRENGDWRDILSQAPYCIKVSDTNIFGRDLVLLKYDQLNSDFSNPIVCECRGLILDAHTADIVSFPFVKFFNYGESHAANIDWNTAFVSQKLDGSIVKVVNMGNNNFLISTNGVIDAFACEVANDVACPYASFGELAMDAFKFYGITKDDFPELFKEGFTYMFELTSPWNQVVVKWDETKMNLIGVRNNITGQEIPFMEHPLAKVFNTPKIYPIRSIEDCVAASKELPDNEEGYVVCDANFNRVKVKSPKYLQLHYMAGNQTWSPTRVFEIFRANEVSEYVAYFPRFKAAFDVIKVKYEDWVKKVSEMKVEIDSHQFATKKDLAMWVFEDGSDRKFLQGFAFAYYDGKVGSVDDWIATLRTSQIVEALGY